METLPWVNFKSPWGSKILNITSSCSLRDSRLNASQSSSLKVVPNATNLVPLLSAFTSATTLFSAFAERTVFAFTHEEVFVVVKVVTFCAQVLELSTRAIVVKIFVFIFAFIFIVYSFLYFILKETVAPLMPSALMLNAALPFLWLLRTITKALPFQVLWVLFT